MNLVRWQSSMGSQTSVLEWIGGPVSPAAVAAEVGASLSALEPRPAFLFARAHRLVSAAANFYLGVRTTEASGDIRLLQALDRASLAHLAGCSETRAGEPGLLLDDVDEETPLAEMVNPAIEAIRFRAEFVHRAARDPRLACALEAMLELARNCGLATLGPASAPNDEWLMPGVMFDYVPSYKLEPAPALAAVPTSRRTASGSGTLRSSR